MPASYKFESNYIYLIGAGEYTTDELKVMLDAALQDTKCPADPKLILDIRNSDSLGSRNTQEIEDMATFLSARSEKFAHTCAILAEQELHYGLMRMGAAFAEFQGMATSVFLDSDEAMAWLESLDKKASN